MGPGVAVPERLAVTELTLTAFRNYPRLRLDLDDRPVVLMGPNGAGKTNLLEAISYLGAGRGLRGARLADVDCRFASPNSGPWPAPWPAPWAVAAAIQGPHGRFEVGTGRDGESTVSRRLVRIDGKAVAGPQALAENMPMLWLTPAQDRLFQDQPGSRRRFLDKLVAVLDPSHGTRIGEYERALRERARLLREKRADPDWLTALERTMAESGIAIAAARRLGAADLTRNSGAGTGPFPAAIVTAAGEIEEWLGQCPALEAEDRLARALAASRHRDGEVGGAAHGPHRTDMMVIHADQGLAARSMSSGEQKTLLLSIILGAARLQAEKRGFTPVLLLDEVSAHLDENYRRALYEEVMALGAQAWLTGTDAGLFAALEGAAHMFKVADGNVHEMTSGVSAS